VNTKDRWSQIIQDAAQSYEELAKWELRLSMLQEAEIDANRMEAAVAQVHLRGTEALGSGDILREHLSKLAGPLAGGSETDPDTIPTPPPLPTSDETARESLASNPSIEAGVEHARAQYLRARWLGQ
jgi:hypothetical protein